MTAARHFIFETAFLFVMEGAHMKEFQELLDAARAMHGNLCAGQVLGVRMAQAGLSALGVDPEREPKRIIVIVESDRCAADAVAAVARVSLGKRTLKHLDYGKMAATFLDTRTGRAVRVVTLESARARARDYAPAGLARLEAQLIAYQRMPEAELLAVEDVGVQLSEYDSPGPPLKTVLCDCCGEGINDNREVVRDGMTLCRACAGQSYYVSVMSRGEYVHAANDGLERTLARSG
jgi:formylmethanofuran dehydrogenase subunit E